MRWRLAAKTEVAGRAHKTSPEVMHPHAVDDHACGQRIRWIDNGAREFQTSASLPKRPIVAAAEARQKSRWRKRARIIGVAAKEHVSRRGFRLILHSHGSGRGAVVCGERKHVVVSHADRSRVVAIAFRVNLLEVF